MHADVAPDPMTLLLAVQKAENGHDRKDEVGAE